MSRGRPKKKPNVDTAKEIAEMVKEACELMVEPYDDRVSRSADLPSMNEVAREMDVTIIKLKRLLITGGYYSSATSRGVRKKMEEEHSDKSKARMETICEDLNIRPSSFYSNIPYSKGMYNLKEPSLYADQSVRYRMRRKAVAELQESIKGGTVEEQRLNLWRAVCAFQDYSFRTSGRGSKPGVKFKYSVSTPGGSGGRHYDGECVDGFGNEMWITTAGGEKKKSISRSTVERAFQTALENEITGSKALSVPGAHSYLYPIFVRFGVIGT